MKREGEHGFISNLSDVRAIKKQLRKESIRISSKLGARAGAMVFLQMVSCVILAGYKQEEWMQDR
jgi:hypothetical protein